MSSIVTESTHMLRHMLATIAYRLRKALFGAPDKFEQFSAGGGVRSPAEILHHMSQLLTYAITYFEGEYSPLPEVSWLEEKDRFKDCLSKLDKRLESGALKDEATFEQLLQGPLSDVMTHVGQICMLRRMAGSPVERERFFLSDIQTGAFEI